MFNKLKRFGLLLVLILLFMGCITSAKTSSYQEYISNIFWLTTGKERGRTL